MADMEVVSISRSHVTQVVPALYLQWDHPFFDFFIPPVLHNATVFKSSVDTSRTVRTLRSGSGRNSTTPVCQNAFEQLLEWQQRLRKERQEPLGQVARNLMWVLIPVIRLMGMKSITTEGRG
jgi:hypothetical protein